MCMLATVNTGSARHCASSSLEIVLQIWNICFDPIEWRPTLGIRWTARSQPILRKEEGKGKCFVLRKKCAQTSETRSNFRSGYCAERIQGWTNCINMESKHWDIGRFPIRKTIIVWQSNMFVHSFPLDMISSDGFVSRPEHSSKIRKFWFDWLRILVPKSVVLADLNGPLKQFPESLRDGGQLWKIVLSQ